MQKQNPWLNAWKDPIAGLSSFSQLIDLGDIMQDGDKRLIIADICGQLRIFKGINIEWEYKLPFTPSSLTTFYTESPKGNILTVAVGMDNSVYMFQNNKVYYKFSLPSLEIPQQEKIIWKKYQSQKEIDVLIKELQDFQKQLNQSLSWQSIELLNEQNKNNQIEIFQSVQDSGFLYDDFCIFLSKVQKNTKEENGLSHLVIGTEMGFIYILNNNGIEIEKQFQIQQAIPAFIDCCGSYDLKENTSLLSIVCREQKLFFIFQDQLQKNPIELESKVVDMCRIGQALYLASMDQKVQGYLQNVISYGTKCLQLNFQHHITNIAKFEYGRAQETKLQQMKGLLVALDNKELRLYNNKQLIYMLECEDTISGLKFGQFGREDGCLIMIYKRKGIDVRILQRQFNFEKFLSYQGTLKEKKGEYNELLPKKTKLFLEDTQRERDNPIMIHQEFQQDLLRLQALTTKSYLNLLTSKNSPQIQQNLQYNLRMHSNVLPIFQQNNIIFQIEGLGPLFKIHVIIENLSQITYSNLYLTYYFNKEIYSLKQCHKEISYLIPHIQYPIEIEVINIDKLGANDIFKIFLSQLNNDKPIIALYIEMPLSEMNID